MTATNRLDFFGEGPNVQTGVYGGGKAQWQSHTYNHPGGRLVRQKDRNLAIYSRSSQALWQSGTYTR